VTHEVLKVREVATLLRVSTATIYTLAEKGELAHFRVSNAIRFERGAVDEFIA
jgi:excisionase family DNA binding protein